ncbi:MAG: tripartite tricarboxylate transporter substrate binding protein [Betaproteobacteria bacterium]|nr:tripartite tricarboxylate transporter substrate binding protein [Betaproteobacteria bacterium]
MLKLIRPPLRPMLGALLLTLPGLVPAATPLNYPTKPIRLVVSFAPGGGTDIFARAMGLKYTEAWGEPVIVDNRAGGNGNIGTDMVAKAPGDGYTLLLTTNATIVINPNLAKLPYDPVKDFAPISQLAALPFVLSVHPSSPAKTTAELIALAKAKPGQLNYASSGAGGGAHLAGEMLKTMAKIDMTHVPYKGGSPALLALAGAQVDLLFLSILTSTPLIQSKKVRALAVTGPKRSPALPDVPAVAETPGLAGFESDLWYGMLAPAKTAPGVVDKIYQETRRMLTSPEFRNRFEPTGTALVASSPQGFAATIKTDLAKWATVIKSSSAKMD